MPKCFSTLSPLALSIEIPKHSFLALFPLLLRGKWDFIMRTRRIAFGKFWEHCLMMKRYISNLQNRAKSNIENILRYKRHSCNLILLCFGILCGRVKLQVRVIAASKISRLMIFLCCYTQARFVPFFSTAQRLRSYSNNIARI